MRIGCVASAPGFRDNGTFAYCRYALKEELGIDIRTFHRSSPIPDDHECDFWFFCDDGLDAIPMPDLPHPNSCFLVDSHLGWDVRREWANHFDFVFCAQKPAAEKLREEGLNAYWLPLACSQKAHPNFGELRELRKGLEGQLGSSDKDIRESAQADLNVIFAQTDLSKQYDVTFVGYMNRGVAGHPKSHDRVEYLDKVFKAFPNSFLSVNTFHEQMAARYVMGRVGFHVSILDDVAMRMFEIPSTGTAMLANKDVVGLEGLGFVDGKNFVGYEGIEDAVDKCRWMLENPMEREEIAKAGHVFVRSNHTYKLRMESLLKVCGISHG